MVLIMETPFGKDDLMAMLDSVEDAVVKLDGSAKYVAMNKAAADIFRRLGQEPSSDDWQIGVGSISRPQR
jgi:sensor histidine kinase regulating citrate/malate metabolism